MSIFSTCLPALTESETSLETFGRGGELVSRIDGSGFIRALVACRREIRRWPVDGPKLLGLLFRSEETIEFLIASLAAMAEGYTVVPLYPNWDADSQLLYLRRYAVRSLAVGGGFERRAREWELERLLRIDVEELLKNGAGDLAEIRPADIFPDDLPGEQACAWIFTSGTSGELAKCTEITLSNLDAAIENIHGLDFLREGMVVHSPLSASHIFAFVVIMAFMALKPRRVIFSDVQYLSRLSEEKIGKVDALILVPIVLNRLRSGFYEKLTRRASGKKEPPELRKLTRIPLPVRKGLKRLLQVAENSVIQMEQGRRRGRLALPFVHLSRALFGKMIRQRLGSPDFVVVGGAKPNLQSMALLEVLGIRCLQGWGMTETTGPLAVCSLHDRFQGAFGTCGELFPRTSASIEEGELVVEGPQIARGYVEPGGKVIPFNGRKKTGDSAIFDLRGRLKVLGKASDRITTDNGLNYNPIPMEDALKALDLKKDNLLDEVVVVGDARPRLGAVLFLREGVEPSKEHHRYVESLLRTYNTGRPVDEKIAVWAISKQNLRDAGGLGPSGKVVRRHIERSFAHIYGEVLV